MALFLLGSFFIFLAIWFLPFILVAPRKCANLINVGSILIIASFAVIKGAYKFLVEDLLFNEKRWYFAWLYLLSLCVTLYASKSLKSGVLTLISLVIEMGCLAYFISSYFPGGPKGMRMLAKSVFAVVKTVCTCCAGSEDAQQQ